MVDFSNYDVERLQALILEMDRTLNILAPDADSTPVITQLLQMEDDMEQLHGFILDLAHIIHDLTPSSQLKGIVNSVLDCITVDEAFDALRTYNGASVWHRRKEAAEAAQEDWVPLKLVV